MGAKALCSQSLDGKGCAGITCAGACNFAVAVEQVVLKREAAPWHASIGDWFAGSQPSAVVEIAASRGGEPWLSRRTGGGKQLSQDKPGLGKGGQMTELWGWEECQDWGPRTSEPLEFSVPATSELVLKVMVSQTPSASLEVAGQAVFRLAEDVMTLPEAFVPRPYPGTGAYLTLPLSLNGRDCGNVSLIARLPNEDPKVYAAAVSKTMELDYVLSECRRPSAIDDMEDAVWTPRERQDQPRAETLLSSKSSMNGAMNINKVQKKPDGLWIRQM